MSKMLTRLVMALSAFWRVLRGEDLVALGALRLLSVLQQQARLVDFVHEDLDQYEDAEIAAAARVVHRDLGRVLWKYVLLEPVRAEALGELVSPTDQAGIRWTGLVEGTPSSGRLMHGGWRARDVRALPEVAGRVVQPAEVEAQASGLLRRT